MKRIKFFLRILAALLIVQIYACEKLIENLPGKPKNCRIKRIHFHSGVFGDYDGNFYYNKWGNPDSVIYGFTMTGSTNQIFRYNQKQQLILARFTYSQGGIERLHKFGYTRGIITSDTFYTWPTPEEPEPLNYVSKAVINIEYDNLGRVIKDSINFIYPYYDPQVINYVYNANGNQVYDYAPYVEYDNYNNFRVLHPIWQFLTRDYSLNNPIPAVKYNNFRLPTKFDQTGFLYYPFFDRSMLGTEIEYDCK